jgi:hypothetical protein
MRPCRLMLGRKNLLTSEIYHRHLRWQAARNRAD